MLKIMKKILRYLFLILIIATLSISLWEGSKIFRQYYSPPRVTLINLTGEDISSVSIKLNQGQRTFDKIKNKEIVECAIPNVRGEASTQIEWTDSEGKHNEFADDYIEGRGFYHTTVVLTQDKKAVAVYKMRKN